MTASVAATELAKLGKCEAMIKKVASHPRPARQSAHNRHRGQIAPFGVSSLISDMKRQPCAL